jgi:hypothetical protein
LLTPASAAVRAAGDLSELRADADAIAILAQHRDRYDV